MNATEIALLIKYVRGQWPHYEINDGTPVAYQRLLGDLRADDVLAAIDDYAVKGEKFAPSPGAVRRLTITRMLPAIPEAGAAWGELLGAIRSVGSYGKPDWSSPLIGQIVERFGGWQHICQTWTIENEMADRAHFLRMWGSMTETELTHATEIGAGHDRELEDRFSERADLA